MSTPDTKQKIIGSAIELFNENGIANVRLQQIADASGISVGNLAYHFRNKFIIISAVYEQISEEICHILSNYRNYPNFSDFDSQLSFYYRFLQKYPFYFSESVEIKRNFPEIFDFQQQLVPKIISQIRKRFDFNIQRGAILPEPHPNLYDNTAQIIGMIIIYWDCNPIVMLNQNDSETLFKETVWNQIYPYFTLTGKAEFEKLISPILTPDN